jgi:NAD-dependent SIR2 family protein deacetylase
VWFDEALDERVMQQACTLLDDCDILIVAGTSAVVYPAAGFALQVNACASSLLIALKKLAGFTGTPAGRAGDRGEPRRDFKLA